MDIENSQTHTQFFVFISFYFQRLDIKFMVSTIVRYIESFFSFLFLVFCLFETQIYHLVNKSNESITSKKKENFSNIHSLIMYGNMIKIYSFEFSIKVKQNKNNRTTIASTAMGENKPIHHQLYMQT